MQEGQGWQLSYDAGKARFVLSYTNEVNKQTVDELKTVLPEAFASVGGAFDLIVHLSHGTYMDRETAEYAKDLHVITAQSHVRKIVRVTERAIVKMQINRVSRTVYKDHPEEVTDLESAHAVLDALGPVGGQDAAGQRASPAAS